MSAAWVSGHDRIISVVRDDVNKTLTIVLMPRGFFKQAVTVTMTVEDTQTLHKFYHEMRDYGKGIGL